MNKDGKSGKKDDTCRIMGTSDEREKMDKIKREKKRKKGKQKKNMSKGKQ